MSVKQKRKGSARRGGGKKDTVTPVVEQNIDSIVKMRLEEERKKGPQDQPASRARDHALAGADGRRR